MTPDISNLKGGGVLIAAKSSTPWCSRTGRLFPPNRIEGKRGIAVRGSELCRGPLNVVRRREPAVQGREILTTEVSNHTAR